MFEGLYDGESPESLVKKGICNAEEIEKSLVKEIVNLVNSYDLLFLFVLSVPLFQPFQSVHPHPHHIVMPFQNQKVPYQISKHPEMPNLYANKAFVMLKR